MENRDDNEFSEEVIEARWELSGGKCEKCGKNLVKSERGFKYGDDGWTAHHYIAISSGGTGSLQNCRILCNACHEETSSFGRH